MSKKSTKECISEKDLTNVSKMIQHRVTKDEVKFILKQGDTEINVLTDVASSIMSLSVVKLSRLFNSTMSSVDFSNYEKLFINTKGNVRDHNIIFMLNSGNYLVMREMAYRVILNKLPTAPEIIAESLIYSLCLINKIDLPDITDSSIDLNYGIDSAVIITFLLWAKQNGLIDAIINYPGKLFGSDPFEKYSELDYKSILCEYNTKFGEDYYNYKTGKIKDTQLSEIVGTIHSTLVIPKCSNYVTSPEYSWQITSDIFEGKSMDECCCDDKTKQVFNVVIQSYYTELIGQFLATYNSVISGAFYRSNKKYYASLRNYSEHCKQIAETSEKKHKDIKAKFKEMQKLLKQYADNNKGLQMQLNKALEKLQDINGRGHADYAALESTIDMQKNELVALRNELNSANRQLIKKNETIKSLNKSLDYHKDRATKLDASVNELSDKCSSILTTRVDEPIPMQCIVNSIKDYRIVVFGGDMMHDKLRKMGFNNLKLIPSGANSVDCKDLRCIDIIVIVVGYIGHADMAIPKNASETYNIPILYFDNKNVNMLCRDIFTRLNNPSKKQKLG